MKIITGATGTTHVTSNNDGEFNQAIFGEELVVLSNGNQLDAEITNNNLITVKDGDLVLQGRHALIDPGTVDELSISTGVVDINRNDLIVARYELDNTTGYESLTLAVIEGTESSGVAVDPEYTSGVIRTGAILVEVPLYRVRIEGITIVGLDKLFKPIPNIIDGVGEIGDTDISTIGDGTITGAIGSLNENLANFVGKDGLDWSSADRRSFSINALTYETTTNIDGYAFIDLQTNVANNNTQIIYNGVVVASNYLTAQYVCQNISIPITKGKTLKFNGDKTLRNAYITYVPYK